MTVVVAVGSLSLDSAAKVELIYVIPHECNKIGTN